MNPRYMFWPYEEIRRICWGVNGFLRFRKDPLIDMGGAIDCGLRTGTLQKACSERTRGQIDG